MKRFKVTKTVLLYYTTEVYAQTPQEVVAGARELPNRMWVAANVAGDDEEFDAEELHGDDVHDWPSAVVKFSPPPQADTLPVVSEYNRKQQGALKQKEVLPPPAGFRRR